MNDLQAFKVINSMPGGRRTMPFNSQYFDRYVMFYRDGRRVEVSRDAVTQIVRIVLDGVEIGPAEMN
jgi:hypothetical protein